MKTSISYLSIHIRCKQLGIESLGSWQWSWSKKFPSLPISHEIGHWELFFGPNHLLPSLEVSFSAKYFIKKSHFLVSILQPLHLSFCLIDTSWSFSCAVWRKLSRKLGAEIWAGTIQGLADSGVHFSNQIKILWHTWSLWTDV